MRPTNPDADGCNVDRSSFRIVERHDPECTDATVVIINDRGRKALLVPTLWSRSPEPRHFRITDLKGPTFCIVDHDVVEDMEEVLEMRAEEKKKETGK